MEPKRYDIINYPEIPEPNIPSSNAESPTIKPSSESYSFFLFRFLFSSTYIKVIFVTISRK